MITEGSRVRFTWGDLHEEEPEHYPVPGTIGTVTFMLSDSTFFVQWPEGSTSGNDEWSATRAMVEVAP